MSNCALTKLAVALTSLHTHIQTMWCNKNYKETEGWKHRYAMHYERREVLSRPRGSLIQYLFVLNASGEGRRFITKTVQGEQVKC